ncbi:cofactor assembly of complex C subunit B [Picosynechococcus sp. PCC 7003]|uniref:cofactor assembly of complex C subunit B n=1 Tax=Picosynechococcus sp. PCC 7003 TaxID=374981 RepID=UPI000903FFD3|nr:cofactor assembly of complex C subunit B [Picosynechococcus sp. PCC 7003]
MIDIHLYAVNLQAPLVKTVLEQSVITSTLLLTLLLMVGLFFFIRASIKDRTEQVELLAKEPEESIFERLQTYFEQRAYRITTVDGVNNIVTYEGFVPPSGFIAVFLSLLAALGLVCIALVLALLYPNIGFAFLGICLLAPLAGLFYWRKAGKIEKVILQITTQTPITETPTRLITVTAHRDELIQLRQVMPYQLHEA